MVNTINLSKYNGELPKSGASRKIGGGPIYSRKEILTILDKGVNSFTPSTRRCLEKMESLELSNEDVLELLKLSVTIGRFKNSEWCIGKKEGSWMACDAYVVCRQEWIPKMYKDASIEYYLKFAIGKTGQVILMVSCHL